MYHPKDCTYCNICLITFSCSSQYAVGAGGAFHECAVNCCLSVGALISKVYVNSSSVSGASLLGPGVGVVERIILGFLGVVSMSCCICSDVIANLLAFLDSMMSIRGLLNYSSPDAPAFAVPFSRGSTAEYDSVGDDMSSTVSVDGSECFGPCCWESTEVPNLSPASSEDTKSVRFSDFVEVSEADDAFIDPSAGLGLLCLAGEAGSSSDTLVSANTFDSLVADVVVAQREPWDSDFLFSFPVSEGTLGAALLDSLRIYRNGNCGGCECCKGYCRFWWGEIFKHGWSCLIAVGTTDSSC